MSSKWCSRHSVREHTLVIGVLAVCAALLPTPAQSAEPAHGDLPTGSDETAATTEPERPTWRFRRADKPVKVVVLAGSIGAFRREPYAAHLERMCSEVEVRNLSKTGLGAWALRKRFAEQVLDNPWVRPRAVEGEEYWLVFGGGLNSVGAPFTTNHHIRRLFLLAHENAFRVVGLTLTPWGDEADRRFRGLGGLEYRRATQVVSDFILGRLTPREALGSHASSRGDARAPWSSQELPDVAIDLYDSPLRDRDATVRDHDAMRQLVLDDRRWQREHADLDEPTRVLMREREAFMASELPRWYLRAELRSFDHIHPNAEGHRLIATIMCPQLPASWGCTCESAASGDEEDTTPQEGPKKRELSETDR
jgi:hypothetical protein